MTTCRCHQSSGCVSEEASACRLHVGSSFLLVNGERQRASHEVILDWMVSRLVRAEDRLPPALAQRVFAATLVLRR